MKNDIYIIRIKKPSLTESQINIIWETCNFNLQLLNIISNIAEIRDWKYYLLSQLTVALIFCGCWVYAFLWILDSKALL